MQQIIINMVNFIESVSFCQMKNTKEQANSSCRCSIDVVLILLVIGRILLHSAYSSELHSYSYSSGRLHIIL